MTRPWRLLGVTLLVGAAGCGEPATVGGDACPADVAVAASTALVPTFIWMPDCAVGSLAVTTEPGDLVWSVASDPDVDLTPTNRLRSGVIYGTVPPDAHQFGELVPLAPGQSYRVLLRVVYSRGDNALVGTGAFEVPVE